MERSRLEQGESGPEFKKIRVKICTNLLGIKLKGILKEVLGSKVSLDVGLSVCSHPSH